MFSEGIHIRSNFKVTARERGKIVPALCREDHNIWVNLGREFLPKAVSPDTDFSGRLDESYVRCFGFGIGGNKQTVDVAAFYPTLNSDYPGTNVQDKSEHTITKLERPVMSIGTRGSTGTWASDIQTPATLILVGDIYSTVQYTAVLGETDVNLAGTYPSVPISEAGMIISSQLSNLTSRPATDIYNYSSPPDYVGVYRPTVVAYNNFAPITKTTDVALEFEWELQF
jgi:hypothetical protein